MFAEDEAPARPPQPVHQAANVSEEDKELFDEARKSAFKVRCACVRVCVCVELVPSVNRFKDRVRFALESAVVRFWFCLKDSSRQRDSRAVRCVQQTMCVEVDTEEPSNPAGAGPCPPVIEFGQFEINTWYSAPYPLEYTR